MRSVLVTGASGGVGSATVKRLDSLGWRVFGGVRASGAGEALTAETRAVTPVTLDICDELSIAAAREEVLGSLGGQGLDALVNNAGLVVQGPLELLPMSALRRQFEVNVLGQVAVTQAFLPQLRATGGRVVNISGGAARTAIPMLGAISASKAALESLSDVWRMELKHQGVDVSVITPGLLQTRLHEKSAEAARRDGQAGDEATRRLYARVVEVSDQLLVEAREKPVDIAVDAIVKALTARRPAARYLVGADARLLAALALLPDRLRDRLLMRNRRLTPGLFSAYQPRRPA